MDPLEARSQSHTPLDTFVTSRFIAIVALNIAYTGFTGLVSDVVPADQMGFASGIMGTLTALGAVVGLLALGFWVELDMAYAIYAVAVLVTTPFTWYFTLSHLVKTTAVLHF